MLGQNTAITSYQISNYFNERVAARKAHIHKALHIVAKIVQEILKEVEAQEPRFISTLIDNNGRYEGVIVHSPNEYEIILYLNQMGVFNFVDDGSITGCAVLKLSDGRKRSMSLWVEFITASGYLSARKIRSRFLTLVGQSIDKLSYNNMCKLMNDTSDVRIKINDKYIVQITCAFRCNAIWPRSANQWPRNNIPWPSPTIINDIKNEGFDLFSKETNSANQQQNKQASSMEGDAWAMSLNQAENSLLQGGSRRKTFSILKCLRDTHLDFPSSPITNYILKTLLLFECEKHFNEYEWEERYIGDRVIGVLLQLVSCLQCRKCPHYFLPQLDLLKGKSAHSLDQSAKITWKLVRQLMLNLFNHVVFGGKYERSQLLISTYKALDRDASSKRILEVTKVAACLEICQAFLLTIDDIMDDSIKRRGKNCWHTLPSIGLNACNDAILLDCIVHDVLNDALVQDCNKYSVVHAFAMLKRISVIGQMLDGSIRHLSDCSWERYRDIVNNKTSYYSFYSPIKIACLLADQPLVPSQWKSLAFKSGYLFQAQDDYIDCFGESIITGKIGSDLREGKCTWIICKALDQTVSRPDIRRTLTDNFGKKSAENVNKAMNILSDLQVNESFLQFEREYLTQLLTDIEKLPDASIRQVYRKLAEKLRGRRK